MSFKFCKISETAILPKYVQNGYSIFSSVDAEIMPNIPSAVSTGFSMEIPSTHCALITPFKIKTLGGLIDSDYRGEVKVILVSKEKVKIKKGEEIAKMHVLEIETPEIDFEQNYPTDNLEEKKINSSQ